MNAHHFLKIFTKKSISKCIKSYSLQSKYSLDKFLKSTKLYKTNLIRYSVSSDPSRENRILTVPNLLCFYRIGISPFISYGLLSEHYSLAFVLMATAAFSDLIDGLIARKFTSQKSLIGSFLDPLADKILIFTLTVTLWHMKLLPNYLMGLFMSKDILLIIGATYYRYTTLEKYTSPCDIFNPKLNSKNLQPLLISKINTLLQFMLICTSMGIPFWGYGDSEYLLGLQLLCCATTIGSGFAYALSKEMRKHFKR